MNINPVSAFEILSNSHNRKILNLLKKTNKCFYQLENVKSNNAWVCIIDIQKQISLPQSLLSIHLLHLKKVGLIEVKCSERDSYYKRNEDNIAAFVKVIEEKLTVPN